MAPAVGHSASPLIAGYGLVRRRRRRRRRHKVAGVRTAIGFLALGGTGRLPCLSNGMPLIIRIMGEVATNLVSSVYGGSLGG